jgi:hypothetical protein
MQSAHRRASTCPSYPCRSWGRGLHASTLSTTSLRPCGRRRYYGPAVSPVTTPGPGHEARGATAAAHTTGRVTSAETRARNGERIAGISNGHGYVADAHPDHRVCLSIAQLKRRRRARADVRALSPSRVAYEAGFKPRERLGAVG